MSDPFDSAIDQAISRAEGGEAMDLIVGADGLTTYAFPEPTMPAYAGVEDQADPFAIAGPVEPMTAGEFGQKVAGVGTGIATGAVTSTLGLPGDIAGLIEGVSAAAGAEEGKRFESFLTGLSEVSKEFGSEFFVNAAKGVIEGLPISEEAKQDILAGSKYIGEFAEVPGGALVATSAMSGLRKIKEIADQADSQYMFPFDQLDQVTTIAPGEVAEFEELARQYRFTQPIESADDAVTMAKTNQQILGRSGSSIAKKLGVKFKNPGIKGELDRGKRMAEKAQAKGGIRALSDITRGGFAVQTVQQADQVVEELAKKYRVIDEGFTVTDLGYFDRKLMIVNKNGQLGEVQIWAEPLFSAKIEKGGQDLYTISRGKTPDEMDAEELAAYQEIIKKYDIKGETHQEIVADAKDKSVELYAKAIDELDQSMREIAVSNLRRMVAEGGKEAETANIMLNRLGEAAQ